MTVKLQYKEESRFYLELSDFIDKKRIKFVFQKLLYKTNWVRRVLRNFIAYKIQ